MDVRVSGTGGNRSRERMKQETVYLRETVAALEAQLVQLRAHQTTVVANVGSGDPSVRAKVIANAAWQDIAERQRRLRFEAEVENNKLREFLEDQIRLGKALAKLLHRRQHAEVESILGRRLDTKPISPQDSTGMFDNPALRSDLKASLAAQYSDTHAVFGSDCFTQESGAFRNIDLRYRDAIGTFVETSERRLLPFTERMVSDAVLQQFDTSNSRTTTVQESWGRDDYFEFDMTSMIDTTRFHGVSQTKIIVQRIVEQDYTVFLFAGITDPSESLGAACDGLYIRHRGWTRVVELPKPDPSSPTVTEYATYHIATPEILEILTDQKRKIGTLTNYVLHTLDFQMDVGRESIDNYLLARATEEENASPLPKLPARFTVGSPPWGIEQQATSPPRV